MGLSVPGPRSGRANLAVAGCLILLLSPVGGALASASGWSIERTPTDSGASSRSLGGVACVPTTICTAVGSSTNPAGAAMTLAARSG